MIDKKRIEAESNVVELSNRLHENEVKYNNSVDNMAKEYKEKEVRRAQTVTDEIQKGMEELEKKYLKTIEEMELSHQKQLEDTQKEQQDVLGQHVASFEQLLAQKEARYQQAVREKEAECCDKQKELDESAEIIASFVSKEEELRLAVAGVEEKYVLLLTKKDEQLRLLNLELSKIQSDCQSMATSNEKEYIAAVTSLKALHATAMEENAHKYHDEMQILIAELTLVKEKYSHSDSIVRSLHEEIKALQFKHGEERDSILASHAEELAEERNRMLETIKQLTHSLDKVRQEKTETIQQLVAEHDIKVDQLAKSIEVLEVKIVNKSNEIELQRNSHSEELSHVLTRQQQSLLDKHRDEIENLRKLNQDIELRHQEVPSVLFIDSHSFPFTYFLHSPGINCRTRDIC